MLLHCCILTPYCHRPDGALIAVAERAGPGHGARIVLHERNGLPHLDFGLKENDEGATIHACSWSPASDALAIAVESSSVRGGLTMEW